MRSKSRPPAAVRRRQILVVTAYVLGCAVMVAAWFGSFPYRSFMGDDLRLILNARTGGAASSIGNSLTQAYEGQYRPLTHLAYGFVFPRFGTEFRSYVYLNALVECVNVLLVGLLAFRLSDRSWLAAGAASLLTMVSRFAYFLVLQVYGLMEGLATTLFLLALLSLWQAYRTRRAAWLGWCLLADALLVHVHERFLVLAVFIGAAILLSPVAFRRPWIRWVSAASPITVAAGNLLIKILWVRTDVFMGPAAARIDLDVARIGRQSIAGALNLAGFNLGPGYRVGLPLAEAGAVGWLLGMLLLVTIALLFLTYLGDVGDRIPTERRRERQHLMLGLLLLVSLLMVASITPSQEHRWLYAPYIVMLLGLARAYGQASPSMPWRTGLLVSVVAAGLAVDSFYRKHLDNVFFIKGLKTAASAKARIVDRYSESDLETRATYLAIGREDVVRDGYFKQDAFFRFYRPAWRAPVIYVSQVDDISPLDGGAWDRASIFALRGDELVDVTAAAKAAIEDARPSQSGRRVSRLQERANEVLGTGQAATPTGQGVFTMMWPSPLGPVTTLTIVSGFAVRYPNLEVDRGAVLAFSAAMPLTIGDGARAYVSVEVEGKKETLLEARLQPGQPDSPSWRDLSVDLGRFAGRRVAIVLGVDSPGGNAIADWVAFSRVRLVAPLADSPARPTTAAIYDGLAR